MKTFRRNPTWFELRIPEPVKGVVFVHSERKNNPLMVTSVKDDTIYRVNLSGEISEWGDVTSWRDEVRRRVIEVVYAPDEGN